MSTRSLVNRPEPWPYEIVAGRTISSGQHWFQMGGLANWLQGQGGQMVPGVIAAQTIAGPSTAVFNFRSFTKTEIRFRYWFVMLRTTTPGVTAVLKAPASTGVAQTVNVPLGRPGRVPFLYVEPIASFSGGVVTNLSIEIAIAATANVEVDSITCIELNKPIIDAFSIGSDLETLRPREPIVGNDSPNYLGGVADTYKSLDAKRVGLYSFAVPQGSPLTRTTNTYVNVLDLGAPILAPNYQGGGSSVAGVYWTVYARVNAGTGNVRITTSQSLVSDSVAITNTSFAWSTPRLISVSSENMTTDDGLQGLTFDEMNWGIQGPGGANVLSVAGFCVWNQTT